MTTAIDRLGLQLRNGAASEGGLRTLEEYRRSFKPAYRTVVEELRRAFAAPITGRPAKSTHSIVQKLRRESLRLSQMQDVAGCRLVVSTTVEQDVAIETIRGLFAHCRVQDRRIKPSHGYRAVHVIVCVDEMQVEVQLRTELQHQWAEWSEKLGDVIDPEIKYGGGPTDIRELLDSCSYLCAELERSERLAASQSETVQRLLALAARSPAGLSKEVREDAKRFRAMAAEIDVKITAQKQQMASLIRDGLLEFSANQGRTQ